VCFSSFQIVSNYVLDRLFCDSQQGFSPRGCIRGGKTCRIRARSASRRIEQVYKHIIQDDVQLYEKGGIEKLKEVNFYRPESKLCAHITSLEAHFRENPPATIKEAQSEIEAITGIERSETQVREFLKKNCICVAGKWA
jgi:transposase